MPNDPTTKSRRGRSPISQLVEINSIPSGDPRVERDHAPRASPVSGHAPRNPELAGMRARIDELEASNRHLQQALAFTTHEIRGRLGNARGWLALLAEGTLAAEEQKKAIGIVQRSLDAQSKLVDDLLDACRLGTTHRLTLELELVSVEDIVRQAVESHHLVAVEKSIALLTQVEPGLRLVGDAARLSQVLSNLLGNALKFTSGGGQVQLRASRHPRRIVIEVRDDGRGIAPSVLPHVFDPFFRTDDSPDGLGVGLFLVRELVRLHGGTVEAQSALGHGTTFRLFFDDVVGNRPTR